MTRAHRKARSPTGTYAYSMYAFISQLSLELLYLYNNKVGYLYIELDIMAPFRPGINIRPEESKATKRQVQLRTINSINMYNVSPLP